MKTVDEYLRDIRGTVPADDDFARAAIARLRERSLRGIAPAAHRAGGRRRGVRGRSSAALALSILAAATAVVLVVVARPRHAVTAPQRRGVPGTSRSETVRTPAQVVLFQAARDVIRTRWRPLAPGQWLYFRFEISNPGKHGRASTRPDFVEDEWLAGDGGARVVQYSNADVLLVGAARRQLRAELARQRRTTHFHVTGVQPPWPPTYGYRQIVVLPSDVRGLRRWIRAHAVAVEGSGERGRLAFIQQLVIDPRLPPAVAASLDRVIAGLPGVATLGAVRDPLGRRGVAVGFTESIDTQTQIIFDPSTGRTLAVRQASLGQRPGDPPRGTVTSWWAVSRQAVVRSDDLLPRG